MSRDLINSITKDQAQTKLGE